MVALRASQAKETLLQEWVAFVPESNGQAYVLKTVAHPPQAIFVPAVSPASSVFVGEVIPGLASGAVVLAHRAPGALAEVRAPMLPIGQARFRIGQATVFSGLEFRHDVLSSFLSSFSLETKQRSRTQALLPIPKSSG